MTPDEVDYLICGECESPCYVFELDRTGKVASAFCQSCGGDKPESFRIPDADEVEVDE
jgi:hypothetical protein